MGGDIGSISSSGGADAPSPGGTIDNSNAGVPPDSGSSIPDGPSVTAGAPGYEEGYYTSPGDVNHDGIPDPGVSFQEPGFGGSGGGDSGQAGAKEGGGKSEVGRSEPEGVGSSDSSKDNRDSPQSGRSDSEVAKSDPELDELMQDTNDPIEGIQDEGFEGKGDTAQQSSSQSGPQGGGPNSPPGQSGGEQGQPSNQNSPGASDHISKGDMHEEAGAGGTGGNSASHHSSNDSLSGTGGANGQPSGSGDSSSVQPQFGNEGSNGSHSSGGFGQGMGDSNGQGGISGSPHGGLSGLGQGDGLGGIPGGVPGQGTADGIGQGGLGGSPHGGLNGFGQGDGLSGIPGGMPGQGTADGIGQGGLGSTPHGGLNGFGQGDGLSGIPGGMPGQGTADGFGHGGLSGTPPGGQNGFGQGFGDGATHSGLGGSPHNGLTGFGKGGLGGSPHGGMTGFGQGDGLGGIPSSPGVPGVNDSLRSEPGEIHMTGGGYTGISPLGGGFSGYQPANTYTRTPPNTTSGKVREEAHSSDSIPAPHVDSKDSTRDGYSKSGVKPSIIHNLETPQISQLIERISNEMGISPNLVRGIIAAESSGNAKAGEGKPGYKGLMQAGNKNDQLDAETSLKTGIGKYKDFDRSMSNLLQKYGEDPRGIPESQKISLNMIAYNAGPAVIQTAMRYAHETGSAKDWFAPQHFQRALINHGAYATKFLNKELAKLDGQSLAQQYQALGNQTFDQVRNQFSKHGRWDEKGLHQAIIQRVNAEISTFEHKGLKLEEVQQYPVGRFITMATEFKHNNLKNWYIDRVLDYKNYFDNHAK